MHRIHSAISIISKKPKVIIGAGFAGLSAAYYLYKKSIEFIILEARNRIGGRVFSHAVAANQSDEWKADMIQQTLQPHFGDVKSLLEKQANYYWGNDEFSRGAYAIYGKGQWFRLGPILRRSHIHTHFGGEHLADWQGFMEGAINTGEAAAAKI